MLPSLKGQSSLPTWLVMMQSLFLFPVQTAAHLTHQVVSSSLLMHDNIYVELKAFVGELTSACPFNTFVKACFRNLKIFKKPTV